MLMHTNAQDGNGHAKSLVPLSTPLITKNRLGFGRGSHWEILSNAKHTHVAQICLAQRGSE